MLFTARRLRFQNVSRLISSLTREFDKLADDFSHREAIRYVLADKNLSNIELKKHVDAHAQCLHDSFIKKGDVVACWLPDGSMKHIVQMTCIRLGLVFADWDLRINSVDEIRDALRLSSPKMLCTVPTFYKLRRKTLPKDILTDFEEQQNERGRINQKRAEIDANKGENTAALIEKYVTAQKPKALTPVLPSKSYDDGEDLRKLTSAEKDEEIRRQRLEIIQDNLKLLRTAIPELYYAEDHIADHFHSKFCPSLEYFVQEGELSQHGFKTFRRMFVTHPLYPQAIDALDIHDDDDLSINVIKRGDYDVISTPARTHKEIFSANIQEEEGGQGKFVSVQCKSHFESLRRETHKSKVTIVDTGVLSSLKLISSQAELDRTYEGLESTTAVGWGPVLKMIRGKFVESLSE